MSCTLLIASTKDREKFHIKKLFPKNSQLEGKIAKT